MTHGLNGHIRAASVGSIYCSLYIVRLCGYLCTESTKREREKQFCFVYMILLCRYFIIVLLRIAYLLWCSCPNELCDCITGKTNAQLHAVYTEWINTHGASFIGAPNRPPCNIQYNEALALTPVVLLTKQFPWIQAGFLISHTLCML